MDIARDRIDDPAAHVRYTHGILKNWKRELENPERAKVDRDISAAAKFWRNMRRGTGYLPNDHREQLRDLLGEFTLDEVIDGMKAWGSASRFWEFLEHMRKHHPNQ